MKKMLLWTFGGLGTTVAGVLLSVYLSQDTTAQTTQSGDGNISIQGGNSGTINNTVNKNTITIILEERAYSSSSNAERETLLKLAELLGRLQNTGQLSITRQGVRELADGAIAMVSQRPLQRDNVTTRQFSLSPGRAEFLFGGPNRIAFKHHSWRDYGTFNFNGKIIKVNFGSSIPFSHNGQRCELILNGISNNRLADMTLFCSGT